LRQPIGDAGTRGPMAILVPPAILDEEEAVLDLPVRADRGQELSGADSFRIEAAQKIARVEKRDRSVLAGYVPINTQENAASGETQGMANVIGVVQVEPQSTAVDGAPFFWAV